MKVYVYSVNDFIFRVGRYTPGEFLWHFAQIFEFLIFATHTSTVYVHHKLQAKPIDLLRSHSYLPVDSHWIAVARCDNSNTGIARAAARSQPLERRSLAHRTVS